MNYFTKKKHAEKITREGSFHALLFYVFRVSYIATKFSLSNKGDLYRWGLVKRRLNRLVNHAIFNFLSKKDFGKQNLSDENYRQLTVEAISEIISRHYRRRLKIYRFCNKLPVNSEIAFKAASMLYTYIDDIICLAHSFTGLWSQYSIEYTDISDNVAISIGFPKHGFSISKNANIENNREFGQAPLSSFGDYLLEKDSFQKGGISSFISIDEYVRQSKKNESYLDESFVDETDYITEYPRSYAAVERSLFVFLSRLPTISLVSIKCLTAFMLNLKSFLLVSKYFRLFSKAYRYKDIIDEVTTSGKNLTCIYALPFADIGMLKYEEKYSSLIHEYSYSHNMYIPPAGDINERINKQCDYSLDSILAEVQVAAFCLRGRAIGFTSIYRQINDYKSALNSKYQCRLLVEDFTQSTERPALLGFEKEIVDQLNMDSKSIAIFDVPPQSQEFQLSRAIVGDRSCNYEVIEMFLLDSISECINKGYNVILKPKYSLSNYSNAYQSLIHLLCERFGNKFIVLNPYSNTLQLLSYANGSINFPYTSTKKVSQSLGKPSIYFMPEEYRTSFADDKDFVIGKNELSKFLDNC